VKSDRLVPNASYTIWSTSPCASTVASDYSQYKRTVTVNNVDFTKTVSSLTIGALTTIITGLFTCGLGASVAAGGVGTIVGNVKLLGQYVYPDASFGSYTLTEYGTSKSRPGLWEYTKYDGKFYLKYNLVGTYATGQMYREKGWN
jgi:hypothetical protein